MADKLNIRKTVLDKTKYDLLVDRTFKTFITPVEITTGDQIATFFQMYEDLYSIIPIEGTTESHEYLARKSSELVKIEDNLDSIQPLLDEIAQLREQLLEANIRVLELENSSVQTNGNNIQRYQAG
jgi:phosphoglycerate-specific signal transduction histidine kinase